MRERERVFVPAGLCVRESACERERECVCERERLRVCVKREVVAWDLRQG